MIVIEMREGVEVPEELLWDYRQEPDGLLWKLQRIADFFPAYGTDRETVCLLYKYRDRLKMEKGTYKLTEICKEVLDEKDRKRD